MMITEKKNSLMQGPKALNLKAGDFVIVAVALIVSFLLWGRVFLFEKTGSQAVISADGEKIVTVELKSGEISFLSAKISELLDDFETETVDGSTIIHMTSSGVHQTIEVRDGRIRFRESDCPDRVCVNTGYISVNGQVVACVPAKVLIRITGEAAKDDPDIIIG